MLGLFTVAEVQGNSEIACGELMRFFVEMARCASTLLPSQGVHWEAVRAAIVELLAPPAKP